MESTSPPSPPKKRSNFCHVFSLAFHDSIREVSVFCWQRIGWLPCNLAIEYGCMLNLTFSLADLQDDEGGGNEDEEEEEEEEENEDAEARAIQS